MANQWLTPKGMVSETGPTEWLLAGVLVEETTITTPAETDPPIEVIFIG